MMKLFILRFHQWTFAKRINITDCVDVHEVKGLNTFAHLNLTMNFKWSVLHVIFNITTEWN